MKIEKLSQKKNFLTFLLKDCDENFTSAIRRLIMEEVPTLAVEDVEIKENSSTLYDEMLALRLGLSPIKTDLKSYEIRDECKCSGEGCARCQLTLILKGNKKGYVYATDAESKDPKCQFIYDMPVVKLLAKQKVEVQMIAILGKGKEHTKWSPGWVWYTNVPELKKSSKSNLAECAKCKSLEVKGESIVIKDLTKWNGAAEEICEKNGVEVNYKENNYIFNIESWGMLECKEMLNKSCDIMLGKIEEFEKAL